MVATNKTISSKIKSLKAFKKAEYRRRKRSRRIESLFAAALAIPGLAIVNCATAQTPGPAEVRFQWAGYHDYQRGTEGAGKDRIDISSPMMWARAPLGDSTEIEGSAVIDSVSGASPFYLDSLSGASGLGIDDKRTAADFKVTHYFDRFSAGIGYARSIEDDYLSHSGVAELRWWTEDKNTTLAFSYAFDSDRITCTNDLSVDAAKHSGHYLVGITQVVSPVDIVQSNITYDNSDGYLSDPYKLLDNRPRSRDSFAWLTRYNHYLESINGSIHTDYRIAHDTFGITSHTFEVALYKPIDETWMIRPRVRYYTQQHASFFSTTFPPENVGESFYSADGRLGAFGGITVGLKLERELGDGFTLNVSGDYMEQRPGWVLGGNGASGERRLYAPFFSAGISKRF